MGDIYYNSYEMYLAWTIWDYAKIMINLCIEEFKKQGIWKCNLYVLNSNKHAFSFWEHNEWKELNNDFKMFQKDLRID